MRSCCDRTLKHLQSNSTIHIESSYSNTYALCSNKKRPRMGKFLLDCLNLIRDYSEKNYYLEKAAINVQKNAEAEIKGCFLLINSSCQTRCKKLSPEKVLQNSAKIALILRMIPNISFVPGPLSSVCFGLATDETKNVSKFSKMDTESFQLIHKLTSHFQKTYKAGIGSLFK